MGLNCLRKILSWVSVTAVVMRCLYAKPMRGFSSNFQDRLTPRGSRAKVLGASKSKSTALQVQYLPRRGTQCAKLIIYNIRVIVGDVSRSVFRWLWV